MNGTNDRVNVIAKIFKRTMRTQKWRHVLSTASTNLRIFVLPAVAAVLLLATGCNNSETITGPQPINTGPPPIGNIAGAWTGTFNTNDDLDCDSSISLPAQASFEQNGSNVVGTLTATGFCGLDYPFQGTLAGNTLNGVLTGGLNPPGRAHGTLSGATLEITASNGYGYVMGTMHLHR